MAIIAEARKDLHIYEAYIYPTFIFLGSITAESGEEATALGGHGV